MENNKSLIKIPGLAAALGRLSLHNMLVDIVKAVRQEAEKIEVFRTTGNGCIRITLKPRAGDVDDWLGPGAINVDEEDFGLREFAYGIHPQGSHVIAWEAPDGHTEPVNCYSYSSLKTATRLHFGFGTPQATPSMAEHASYYVEDNGWSKKDGTALSWIYFDGKPILELVVCVSGAKSEEDKVCAMAGLEVSNDTFEYYGFTVVSDLSGDVNDAPPQD